MRGFAYVLLTIAMACAALMVLCLGLAMFSVGSRNWDALALPFGMATMFFFGLGAALARWAEAREEFDRSVRLLCEDLDEAVRMGHSHSLVERVHHVMPSIARFQRASKADRRPPPEIMDLVDLIDYEHQHDLERAERLMVELGRRLGPLRKGVSSRPSPPGRKGMPTPQRS